MLTSSFDYNLPSDLIARQPAKPRDHSRLMIYDRKSKKINHEKFLNLDKYLNSNDVLVFNDSKVFPARLIGKKQSGGRAEVLLLKKINNHEWEAMLGMSNPRPGVKVIFKKNFHADIIDQKEGKTWRVKFNLCGNSFWREVNRLGKVPLPPYIQSQEKQSRLKKQYQTVYSKQIGSAAAPTAGLHFTPRLLRKLRAKGVKFEFVTLHVGLGTFAPLDTRRVEDYRIHEEWVSVPKKTLNNLSLHKEKGRRIIAVGTTSTRTLEAIFRESAREFKQDYNDFVNIYIYPPYKFRFVDALITNFHLPKSSLLVLVSAFAGKNKIKKLYDLAVKLKYRFYSFGDSMFIR